VGAYLTVASRASAPYIGTPTAYVIYRGGRTIRPGSGAADYFWFDTHNKSVDKLADVGSSLLHLDPVQIRSTLGVLSNEASFDVEFPIDWSRVPRSPDVIRVLIEVSISIEYVDANNIRYRFPHPLQRRIQAQIVNHPNPPSGFAPSPEPRSGEFRRIM
jgi:hypothetical protein